MNGLLTLVHWARLDGAGRRDALRRNAGTGVGELRSAVSAIVADVRMRGDVALREYTLRHDGATLDEVEVGETEFAKAEGLLTPAERAAIKRAIETVTRFHQAQLAPPVRVETAPGVVCERIEVPLQAVGLYVPAGGAPLPSTAIMLAVPARLAGCPRRVVCTPPRRDGSADPAVLVAARECGVSAVYKLGGAQAIAALAYGTESVPRVDKIFGPGNVWVTVAKELVATGPAGCAIDLPAGPSEVLVIADGDAHPEFVAADLLAQAEHAEDAQAILVTESAHLAESVVAAVERQLDSLPRRAIATRALSGSRVILVPDLDTAFAISNDYAPEHLILQVAAPRRWLARVRNAGSVFLGAWTPETLGDYCSGTNHVLPTGGHARAQSGLGTSDFLKRISVQEATAEGLDGLGQVAVTLARLEGLEAHARAVTLRLDALTTRGRVMSDVLLLARPDIVALQPYQHAAWNPSLERMHANEMPWRASGDNSEAGLNRYPEPQPGVLLERLSQLYDVPPARILAGRGSDEAIDLLARAFCRAGQDQVVVCPPTFGYYAVAARIQGAIVREVPLRGTDYALDAEAVIQAGRDAKLVFLCTPNNPTGGLLEEAAVLATCRALDACALVVVDEAYVEFSGRRSLAARLEEFPNLVVLRTLSKAYALAGARCGALLASEEIVGLLRRILPPYALPASTVESVLKLTAGPQRQQAIARIATLRSERELFRLRLTALRGVRRVLPSDANFLLAEFDAPQAALAAGCAAGVLVRDLSGNPRLPGCLRFTIGTPEQNERLLAALEAA